MTDRSHDLTPEEAEALIRCAVPEADPEGREAKRREDGFLNLMEAARILMDKLGESDSWRRKTIDEMVSAGRRGALRVRVPETFRPVAPGSRVSMACVVTAPDVDTWLEADGMPYRLTPSPDTQAAPASEAATPAPAGDGALPDWRMRIQAEAYEHWLRLLAVGCSPTKNSILSHLQRWCRDNEVKTAKGKVNPSEGTIRNQVLSGKKWNPPTDTREQARKHVAQRAQVAQQEVAQAAQNQCAK